MATNKELEQQIAELTALLMRHGIGPQPLEQGAIPPKERSDYIEFGSDGHLIYLGLARVDDIEVAEKNRLTVYTSDSGKSYRLVDELGAARRNVPLVPAQGILLELREKVSSFESGPPKPFAGAPARFIPPGDPEFTRIM